MYRCILCNQTIKKFHVSNSGFCFTNLHKLAYVKFSTVNMVHQGCEEAYNRKVKTINRIIYALFFSCLIGCLIGSIYIIVNIDRLKHGANLFLMTLPFYLPMLAFISFLIAIFIISSWARHFVRQFNYRDEYINYEIKIKYENKLALAKTFLKK